MPAASSSRALTQADATGSRPPGPGTAGSGSCPSTAYVATAAAVALASTGAHSMNRFAPCGVIIMDSQTLAAGREQPGPPAAAGSRRRRRAPRSRTRAGPPGRAARSPAAPARASGPGRPGRPAATARADHATVSTWPPTRKAEITGSSEVTKLSAPRRKSVSRPSPVGTDSQVTTAPGAFSWLTQPNPRPVARVITAAVASATAPVRRQARTSTARPVRCRAQIQARKPTRDHRRRLDQHGGRAPAPPRRPPSAPRSPPPPPPARRRRSPSISASLCPPATKWTSTSGLSTPSQSAPRGVGAAGGRQPGQVARQQQQPEHREHPHEQDGGRPPGRR